MTNQFEFNANEVVCNGTIGGCRTTVSAENNMKLLAFLNTHFMLTDKKLLLQELEDSGRFQEPWAQWHIGHRVSNTQQIVDRMTSGLISYGLRKFAENGGTYKAHQELTEMWVNAQIKMMSAKDIITIMESAIIDCATADHYYTFEKV